LNLFLTNRLLRVNLNDPIKAWRLMPRNYTGRGILVTGRGSHLCERLLAPSAEVICVDNYFTGSRRNIAHLVSDPLFERCATT
jgi:hypothetical protein